MPTGILYDCKSHHSSSIKLILNPYKVIYVFMFLSFFLNTLISISTVFSFLLTAQIKVLNQAEAVRNIISPRAQWT